MQSPLGVGSDRLRGRLLAAALAVGVVTFYYRVIDQLTRSHRLFDAGVYFDHQRYIERAESGVDVVGCLTGAAPCRRTLVPAIAGALPVDTQTAFLLITFCSFSVAGFVLYLVLEELGFSTQLSLLGLLFFYTIGPGVKFNVFDFWLLDPAAILVIALATYAILTDRDVIFAVLLLVAIPLKENLILLAPLFYTLKAVRVVDVARAKRTLVYTAPALGAFGFVYLYPLLFQPSWVSHAGSGVSAVEYVLRNPGVPTVFVGALGLLSILPVFSVRRNLEPAVRFGPYVLLVVGQFFLSPFSTRRFMVFAFVPMVVFSLHGIVAISEDIDGILERTATPVALWAPLPLSLILLTPFQRRLFAAEFNKYVVPLRVVVTLLICYVIVLAAGLKLYDLAKCYSADTPAAQSEAN